MRRLYTRALLSAIGLSVCCILLAFVVSNSNQKHVPDEISPNDCNCPMSQARAESLVNPTSVASAKVCHEVKNESAVQRAIVIYYPHHQAEYFFPEIKWLYRSWMEMLLGQPKSWRTDFVIFTYNFSSEFRRLGCVNRIRQTKDEPSMCRLFLYVPIRLRLKNVTDNDFRHAFDDAKKVMASELTNSDPFVGIPQVNDGLTFDSKRSDLLFVNLREYGYIDSINSIYEGYSTFKMYDFILRTDIDVFIYRHFGTYIPRNCSFITGGGGYGTDFNRRKLRRIAHDMGFSHANVSGMGSTWYGSPHDGFLVANQTLHAMLWLALYEFAVPERESKLGTIMWPEWHYGVLLLYGQHLALNHLVAQNELHLIIGQNLLDQSTTNTNPQYVREGIRLNLHCWHTDDRFSKFAFKMGHYNRTELEKFRNDTTVQAYAMRMALESKYMSLEELAAYGRNSSVPS